MILFPEITRLGQLVFAFHGAHLPGTISYTVGRPTLLAFVSWILGRTDICSYLGCLKRWNGVLPIIAIPPL